MTYFMPPRDGHRYELFEANQQDREERIEKARTTREMALDAYPELRGVAKDVKAMQEYLKQDEIAWHEAELKKLKDEAK